MKVKRLNRETFRLRSPHSTVSTPQKAYLSERNFPDPHPVEAAPNHEFMRLEGENRSTQSAQGYMQGEVFFLDSHTIPTT